MYHTHTSRVFYIHLFVDEHLGCFHILVGPYSWWGFSLSELLFVKYDQGNYVALQSQISSYV